MRLTRRAVLVGGAGAAFGRAAPAAEAVATLEAAPGGYGGASPGPLLRVAVGGLLRVRLVNTLAEPTSLYWPGLEGDFPGLAGETIAPGAARDIAFAPTEPGFQLYAPYGPQSAAGLFGGLVVEEAAPPAVDLDAVAIFSGANAAALRVNAGPAPLKLTAPPGGRVRLRLGNAAPDLALTLRASATVHVVAIDGQPSEMFEPRGGEFPLCPSARFELMFDLGDEPVTFALPDRSALLVEPRGARAAAKPAMAALPANPRLPVEIALERAQRVGVVVTGAPQGFAVNGIGGAAWPAKPLFRVKRGTPVALTLVNHTADPQTLRLEGHVARQLHALDDGWDPYWRDALPIGADRTLHAAFVASAPGRWPLASASPDRRSQGLKAWYQVD